MTNDFGEFLVARGLITEEHLCNARLAQQETNLSLPRALVAQGCLTEGEMLQAEAAYVGYPYVDLSNFPVDPKAVFVLPVHLFERYKVLPLRKKGRILVMATSDPLNVIAEDDVRMYSGLEVRWVVAAPDQIAAGLVKAEEALQGYYY